jgi:hypothetical protein
MSCDKLVYDLSQEVEGSPNIFIRKDWLNILDNQNQNYQNNQSIIDTSQLSNSNKYMSYREAYMLVPLTLSLVVPATGNATTTLLAPDANNYGKSDYSIGLKNWFGNIIHSLTLDYNGTTIIQQTPFCNMWNCFKLLTTLSYNDILTQGSTIGFYPDSAGSNIYIDTTGAYAQGGVPSRVGAFVCNNDLGYTDCEINNFQSSQGNVSFNDRGGNYGLTKRISWINYNPNVRITVDDVNNVALRSPLISTVGLSAQSCNQIWKSYIFRQIDATQNANGVVQIAVMATIYLKHVHSFFNMCPLLKGVFMKLTMNLNNATTTVTISNAATAVVNSYQTNVFVGGVNPLQIPSGITGSLNVWGATGQTLGVRTLQYNISVGAICTDSGVNAAAVQNALAPAPLSKSVYLYVPSYTFNQPFESAYLSNSVKQIKYTDIYQYQVKFVDTLTPFNNLITNGIANIKSVLIIPFYSSTSQTQNNNYLEWQSPFDPAGCGATAPYVNIGNFNVQISGQNAIYNMQKYNFEEWNNQLYGQNAVNGGLTDGLTSGLIDFDSFQREYCYYYVNVERMLPVEQSVPKSVQLLGTNYSTKPIDLWVFIEYGVQVNIDVLTGARI